MALKAKPVVLWLLFDEKELVLAHSGTSFGIWHESSKKQDLHKCCIFSVDTSNVYIWFQFLCDKDPCVTTNSPPPINGSNTSFIRAHKLMERRLLKNPQPDSSNTWPSSCA